MDKVVHFEIPAEDISRAKKFYGGVFGWKTEDVKEMDYVIVHTVAIDEKTRMPKEPGAINGGMMKKTQHVKSPVITIGVDDIEKSIQKIEKAGGKILGEKQKVGDIGWSAYAKDSEGNVIGLWQSTRKM
ncbi:MAG: VOC family protein [Candidatus Micrarchaeota archaeon]|nr:VOC family protein [Candidatus Micrarchaeota archaeon]MDE1834468.1 VOC family protein [Candidatus Micrarchaeota archaeon]MDE1859390.1 VOC family protein [Candidatus Micrarchaeota archaeon]